MLDSNLVGAVCAAAFARGEIQQVASILSRIETTQRQLADFDEMRARVRKKLAHELSSAIAAFNQLPR